MLEELGRVRDQILDYAELKPGDRLLDVGCGDGLIGFGALAREPRCSVVFSDVSKRLVDQCQQLAAAAGLTERGRFLVAAAEDLSRVDDGSIDVVTTRSVLIFVEVKLRAFQEFYRVLRPGGCISLSEPINRYFVQPDGSPPPAFEPGPVKDLADRVRAVFMRAVPGAMIDFDERDLVRLIEQAGFQEGPEEFIERRRTLRVNMGEYREPTAEEWVAFEKHFLLRTVALGDCGRPYGTPCVHEHACVRCPFLRIDPAQLPRLNDIERNTRARLDEARQKTWLGEVAGLEDSLTHIARKRSQALELLGRTNSSSAATPLNGEAVVNPSCPQASDALCHETLTQRGKLFGLTSSTRSPGILARASPR